MTNVAWATDRWVMINSSALVLHGVRRGTRRTPWRTRAEELIMTERSVAHATFVIERTYGAPPSRVFEAFASRAAGGRWFIGPDDWLRSDHELSLIHISEPTR